DPDREGEAISWHIKEILEDRKALKGIEVKRVVFNEITKSAVQAAFKAPRDINRELVEAYLARRALDYLVGFTLSPVLWRKLPGAKSAGRVQSVALRLVCEREAEIEAFKPREYWTIDVALRKSDGKGITARLTHLEGKKLDKFDLNAEAQARAAAARLATERYAVAEVETRQVRRHPAPPFTTSTLQQEASRKLSFGATQTMRTAQRLYEGVDLDGETVGLITYMRTDGVQVSQEAIGAVRKLIGQQYGDKYVPGAPRAYATKAKNAQEAHEAIRPTDLFRKPADVARHVSREELALYELIWKRTVASQMESAVLDQVAVDIDTGGKYARLRATGSVTVFDGFLKLYQEDRDDAAEGDDEFSRRLPPLAKGEALALDAEGAKARELPGPVTPEQHFTQPPPRFSEASLVKKLEELGIGRPSTYASILQVLQDRDYVRLDKRRFIPEDRGRLVTAFLASYFDRYVEYDFTAQLEEKLDDVSGGRVDWKALLREFWRDFSAAIAGTKELRVSDVLTTLDKTLGAHFFPSSANGKDPRVCPSCGTSDAPGRLSLKLGKFGAFIGCSNYPNCRYTRPLGIVDADAEGANGNGEPHAGPKLLGIDPVTGMPVTLRKGPYGTYVQLGPKEEAAPAPAPPDPAEAGKPGKKKAKGAVVEKPKRSSLPKGLAPADVDLAKALKLLSLPRPVGDHPETGKTILAGIGRFGPYLLHDSKYASLTGEDDVLEIGLNRAVHLIAEAKARGGRKGAAPPGTPLGDHPSDSKPVTLHAGRYGPYVKHGDHIVSLPRGQEPQGFTLDAAIALLASKPPAEKKGRGKRGAKPAAGNGAKGAKPAKAAESAPAAKAKPAKRKAPAAPAPGAAKPAARAKRASG
ncbi:MAG: type I DNA topoisomerase, partial [Alphaproteobacteria bacterium]|nr:type I DNA topoisomerase [Alphaproteobacteria bacterium]